MEINNIADLNSLRTAPNLSNSEVKKILNYKNDILNGSCSTYFRGRKPNIFCNYINNKLDDNTECISKMIVLVAF